MHDLGDTQRCDRAERRRRRVRSCARCSHQARPAGLGCRPRSRLRETTWSHPAGDGGAVYAHSPAHPGGDDRPNRTRSPAHSRRRRDRAELRALARRVAPTARREGGASDRRPLRGARCHRSDRNRTRAVPDDGNRRRDARGDRRSPEGTRDPRRAHPGNGTPPACRTSAATRARSDSRRTTRRCRRSSACPILLRGVAYGNLYLTEKQGGDEFTDEDEEVIQLLAAQAAVAIENTRLYETSTRWLRHLESLNEIGEALAGELELEPLLGLVARRLRSLVQARIVLIALPEPGGADRLADRGSGRRRLRCVWARRNGSRARWIEDGACSPARPQRAGRLGARRPRDRSAGRTADGCSLGALRSPHRRSATNWRRRGARQARADLELHRRGRAAHRIAGRAGRHRGRAVRAREPGRGAGASSRRRRTSGLASHASCTTRPAKL